MKASTVFAGLARLADAIYGPAATLPYILSEAERRADNARAGGVRSLQDALAACSLSQHPLVVDRRARKASRKQQRQAQRQAETAMAIAILMDSIPKRSRSG